MKVYVIQSKNGIMMTVDIIVNNYMFGILMKSIIFGMLARVILNVITHAKLMNT